MGCALKLAKLLFIIFNVVFFIIGAALLAVGLWVMFDNTYIYQLLEMSNYQDYGIAIDIGTLLQSAIYGLIAVGAFIFIVGFCGCCGALKESSCLLLIYSILVIVILLAQIAFAVVMTQFKAQGMEYLNTYLTKAIELTYTGEIPSNTVSLSIDAAQFYLGCCGVTSSASFASATLWNTTLPNGQTAVIPTSCCKFESSSVFPSTLTLSDNNCPTAPTTSNSNKDTGCFAALEAKISTYSDIALYTVIGLGALELFGIIVSCCLIQSTKSNVADVA